MRGRIEASTISGCGWGFGKLANLLLSPHPFSIVVARLLLLLLLSAFANPSSSSFSFWSKLRYFSKLHHSAWWARWGSWSKLWSVPPPEQSRALSLGRWPRRWMWSRLGFRFVLVSSSFSWIYRLWWSPFKIRFFLFNLSVWCRFFLYKNT